MQTEQIELTNPVDESVGGMGGHIFRRTIHIAMIFIPFLYFEYGGTISSGINLELNQLVSILLLVIVLGDCLLYTSPSPRDLSTSRMPSSA